MTIHFQCDGCRNEFHVPESLAGKTARCNRCGTIVTVPVPGLSFDVEPTAPAAKPGLGYPPAQSALAKPAALNSRGGGLPPVAWIAIGIGGAVAVLVIIAIGLRSLFSSSDRVDSSAIASQTGGGTSIEWSPTPTAPTPPSAPTAPRPYTPTTAGGGFSAAASSSAPASPDPFEAPEESPQPATPTSNTPSSDGSAAPAPSADWEGGGGELRIPFERAEEVVFGPLGCPILISGNDVWDLAAGRAAQTLEGEREMRSLATISADGAWFAAANKSPNQEDTAIDVWNAATGKKVLTIPGDPERFADVIAFTRNKYLAIAGRSSAEIQVWDVETGKQAKSLTAPTERLDRGKLAFTADGQYFAVAEKQLGVFKTATAKQVAQMAAPLSMERSGQTSGAPRRPDPDDTVFVNAWMQDLEFSPDSQELAGISTHPRPRLLCWDHRGKLVLDEPLDQIPPITTWEHRLAWLPDKSGWLVSGNVFDRAAKRVVLGVRKKFGEEMLVHLLDKDRLLGEFPHDPQAVTAIQIPWDRIQASLAAMNDGTPAYLSPSAPVSINIQLDATRGDQQEAARAIGDALVERLARDGVKVERGKSTVFQVKFAEKAGDQLPIYERQSLFDRRGRDTGRSATEAKGSLVIELLVEGETQPLWRDAVDATNSTSFREEINDATVRKSMLENLAREIAELNIPYFIPNSEELLALPVVIE
jgi:WD40 repeat protein